MNNLRNAPSDSLVDLYIRVSTRDQAEEGYSIGEQEARLRSYCEAMNWTVRKAHIDPGYSGGNTNRPALQEMIHDIEAGKVRRVLVYKLDRLSRAQLDTLYLIEKIFLANGVDFVSLYENFDTGSPIGRATIGLLACFAQLEREQIHERTSMGKDARAKEGKWHGGSSDPVGYDYDPSTDELTVNDYEAMQIREAAKMVLRRIPLRTICTVFSEKGYRYRGRGSRIGYQSLWDPKRLKYVLTNRLYLGYIRHHDEWINGNHQAILDEETFARLEKLFAERKKLYAKHTKRCAGQSTYLGGMLYCKHCGGKYAKSGWPTRKGNTKVFYSCYSRSKKVPKMVKDPNCMNKNWHMEELDEIVLGEIKKLALDPEYYNTIRDQESARSDSSNRITPIRNEIAKLDTQISRLMDLYALGQVDIVQVSDKVQELNDQRESLQSELDDLMGEEKILSQDEVIDIACDFESILQDGDLNEIRAVIESLIDRIELDNDDVYIHWKFA